MWKRSYAYYFAVHPPGWVESFLVKTALYIIKLKKTLFQKKIIFIYYQKKINSLTFFFFFFLFSMWSFCNCILSTFQNIRKNKQNHKIKTENHFFFFIATVKTWILGKKEKIIIITIKVFMKSKANYLVKDRVGTPILRVIIMKKTQFSFLQTKVILLLPWLLLGWFNYLHIYVEFKFLSFSLIYILIRFTWLWQFGIWS